MFMLRFTYDDSYFAHRHQGIPVEGYTAMVANMLEPATAASESRPGVDCAILDIQDSFQSTLTRKP